VMKWQKGQQYGDQNPSFTAEAQSRGGF